jgi:VWFA-related protein
MTNCNGILRLRIFRGVRTYIEKHMRLALLLLPVLIWGQDTTFSTDVKVVNVLATVHDKKGQISSNLTKEDFTIEEEGRPQVIKYFSRETDLPLTLGLLVDTSMSQRRVLGDEQRAAYKFLDQVMRQKDQAFIIHFDSETELLQDLTKNRQKLEKALGELEMPRQLQRSTPGSSGRRGGGGTVLYDAVLLASNEIMRDQTGRKAIIILSDGVDNGSRMGLMDAIDAAQRNDTLVYSILFSDEQAYGNQSQAYPPMGRHGGMGGGRPRPVTNRTEDGKRVLERMSMETGGGFFEVSKKQPIDQTFARIQEELRNQYSLGFTSDQPAAPGTFRHIHVATPNQKSLIVQARSGYYAK